MASFENDIPPVRDLKVGSFPFPHRQFSASRLREITDEFRESNCIGSFQFGKVYRGVYGAWEVMVKVWEDQGIYEARKPDNMQRFRNEYSLFTELVHHPDRPKLPYMIGGSYLDGIVAAVYYMKPKDTLYNLINKDVLTWPQRVRVALVLASVLKYFHDSKPPSSPYLIRNLDAAHIMLDEDFNPLLYDFSMISGGIFPDKREMLNRRLLECYGYIDPSLSQGGCSDKSDVFAYGVILLGLITKKVDDKGIRNGELTDKGHKEMGMYAYERAKRVYKEKSKKKRTVSLVDQILGANKHFYFSDGVRITKVALQCVDDDPRKRPTMKQVVRWLKTLSIVQKHWNIVGTGDTVKAGLDELSGIRGSRKLHHLHQHGRFRVILEKLRISSLSSQSALKSQKLEQTKPVKELKIFSKDSLSSCTNSFGDIIGRFQYGIVFRGIYEGREVTVKVWNDDGMLTPQPGDNEDRLWDELLLLQHPKMVSHAGLVSVIGYCFEGCLGLVYDLEPLDTVHNLLLDNENFTWERRMKVALEFASLLEFLHAGDPPYSLYVVRNIAAAHIMLDKNYSPKLIDFSIMCGGIFPVQRREKFRFGSLGYCEPFFSEGHLFDDLIDVYAFGILLICLIAKRKVADDFKSYQDEPSIDEWAQKQKEDWSAAGASEMQNCSFSLVDESLQNDSGFLKRDGELVTELALHCVRYYPGERPSSDEVVNKLCALNIHKAQ